MKKDPVQEAVESLEIQKRHEVVFLSPGSFRSAETIQEIESWDVALAIERVHTIREKYGARPFGFQFRTSVGVTYEDRWHSLSTWKGFCSGTYFINGVVETLEEFSAHAETATDRLVARNMRNLNISHVVTTHNIWKHVDAFDPERDQIVTIPQSEGDE